MDIRFSVKIRYRFGRVHSILALFHSAKLLFEITIVLQKKSNEKDISFFYSTKLVNKFIGEMPFVYFM